MTYLGWTIPWGTPLTLLASTAEEVTAMQRELVRIGIDRPASYAVGGPDVWATGPDDLSSYPVTDFTGLAKQLAADPRVLVLDTRRHSEWTAGHAIGARHLPLHELLARVDEVKAWSQEAADAGDDPRVRVYCGSGFRAAAACSMLERVGVPVEHIDEDVERGPLPRRALAGRGHRDHVRKGADRVMGLFHRTPAVDAGAARQLVSDGAVLLDVREPGEWNAGHAPQAIHQPLGRLAVADRRFTAGRQVVVVCRSGNRSQHAVKALRAAGVDALEPVRAACAPGSPRGARSSTARAAPAP